MASVTISIAVPEKMKAFVEERVRSGEFGNVSEYFRHLVRNDCRRIAEERLAALSWRGRIPGHRFAPMKHGGRGAAKSC
jgi:antitoxin ParD1/3/4